jgi:hypothetical protein
MTKLAISLLGPLQVTLEGHPVTNFKYDKVRALLAYLALEQERPHERDGRRCWGCFGLNCRRMPPATIYARHF